MSNGAPAIARDDGIGWKFRIAREVAERGVKEPKSHWGAVGLWWAAAREEPQKPGTDAGMDVSPGADP